MKDQFKDKNITLAYGNGGQLMQQLINKLIKTNFGNPILNKFDDAAVLDRFNNHEQLVFTTDSFVVSPIFFPGGDIGKLAVCGTVNDLSMMGAKPLYLSVGLIIEEGFSFNDLTKIINSMKRTINAASVKVVCGDTKVVNRGNCDKIFINTSGVGVLERGIKISASCAKAGDLILVSGPIGEHGIAIISQRKGLEFKTKLKSDCALLNGLVESLMKCKEQIHVLRDPTRGGLASVLNEIAQLSEVGIEVDEAKIPVSNGVKGASEILGLDPLYLPCEGRLVAIVAPDKASAILKLMQKNKIAKSARIIGSVKNTHRQEVYLNTLIGGKRILDLPMQEQTPRIC